MLLNQIQDGTSFGVKEMSAKNSNVPTKSRTRAKTSFQALCLSVRATASDSNPAAASFNHLLLLVFLLIIVIESLNGEPSPRRASCGRARLSRFRLARDTRG